MVRILAAFLFAASTDASESISLLQTNAHIHKHQLNALPDPKKQSTLTGTSDTTKEEDYNCAGGKGKWVKTNSQPYSHGRMDVSQHTVDISGRSAPLSFQPWWPNGRVQGGSDTQGPFTEHGPVTDEKDCFARVRIDRMCNHYMEDIPNAIHFNQGHTGLGIWYNPSGPTPNTQWGGENPVCFCGKIDRGSWQMPANINIVSSDDDGMWYCRLNPTDFDGVDENTPKTLGKSKEPKEKKTPEDRAKCKTAKAAAKESRQALKDLRQERKDLRAQMKALRDQIKLAKENFIRKKGLRDGAC